FVFTNGAVLRGVSVHLTGLFLLRKWISGGSCRSRARLDGKTVLITGANGGIGKETARDLARRGARVVMACRDLAKAEEVAVELRRATHNGNIVVRHLDLASLYSVRQFAQDFNHSEERLDVLVNNAGESINQSINQHPSTHTLWRTTMFPLCVALRSSTATSSALARSRHAITTRAPAAQPRKIHFEDIFFDKTPYNSLVSYRQSKLAVLLFSRELARRMRGTGVTSYSLHPGIINTELGRHVLTGYPLLKKFLFSPSMLLMKTPTEGAQTSIYCAVTEGLEEYSGCYFSQSDSCVVYVHGSSAVNCRMLCVPVSDCALKKPAPEGMDDEAARRLWDLSLQLVGLPMH
ncbi:RDH11 dehydrogenase, partial [Amia calva]|nr:RDH11 dehydrogenase [Amia calva]